MKPEDKAFRIYETIRYEVSLLKGTEALINEITKKCAIITVDEILREITDEDDISWFKKVKQEIENL
jgi:hypothetical protein